ncbi:MAG: aminopeptidase P family protein [Chloroflexi bacterium]|nr:aminopeptidase P family protein [Chloroflexota bacterium]
MAVTDRLRKLRDKLLEKELDALLVSQPENYRYLSGFAGASGSLLVSESSAILAVDSIHFEQAKIEAPGFDILHIKSRPEGFTELVGGREIRSLGFESNNLVFSEARRLTEQAGKMEIKLVPTEGLVESLRVVKEDEEIRHLVSAAEMADEAFEYIRDALRPGMSEREAAWEVEKFLRERGSEVVPFEIIVASGPNAALPHARPTERVINEREPILFDLGGRVNGYASDLSRTLCLGPQTETFKRVYDVVLQAQLLALAKLEPGMTGEQVDGIARQVIQEAGYGDVFGHGLGHGVGLDVHEEPRLGPNATGVIADQMVFTIEPGIYIVGWGGVRIEDTVMLDKGTAKMLTTASK